MSKNKKVIIGILIVVLIIIIGLVVVYKITENSVTNRADFNFKTENISQNPVDTINHSTFIKTYNVLNVADSNDENYLYLTIKQFQEEEIKTVKVSKNLANRIENQKDYEFTFKYTDKMVEDNIESIFTNAELISIEKTDKQGLEQIQDTVEKYEEIKKANQEAKENKMDENLEEKSKYQNALNEVEQELRELVSGK